MIRDILAMTFTFLLGVSAATFYFYQLHPEHDFVDDLPLIRKDIDEATGQNKPKQPDSGGAPAVNAPTPAQ
ncbi:MAG: hypothetical protein L6Q71_05170 [Planctomycetes bacterium]|nr:hypothetical protein [Planctomycetota bacterium]NUQ35219.1 hypothetical protein [Planctomycetaceae bacterium]